MSSAAAACVSFRSRMIRSTRTTNPALTRCSPASAKPRSANTLPVLGSCSRAFLLGILHLTAQLFETLPDQIYLGFRRADPRFGLLLKGMYHIDRVPDGDRIDRAEGSACIMDRDLHHPGAETVQRFGPHAGFTQLRDVQRIANAVLDARRKSLDVSAGIGKPRELLHLVSTCLYWHIVIGWVKCRRGMYSEPAGS